MTEHRIALLGLKTGAVLENEIQVRISIKNIMRCATLV